MKKIIANQVLIQHQNYSVRQESKDGTDYLVVPVVMMLEGVHDGSRGPILHKEENLSANPAIWNRSPITINHPESPDGHFISANSTGVVHVGYVDNSRFEDHKLKADAWLNLNSLTVTDPDTLSMIQEGQLINVSLGLYAQEVEEEGVWNDETYVAIAQDYQPDHLAILPRQQGACSVHDGCGIRANSQRKQNKKDMKKEDFKSNPLIQVNKNLSELVDKVHGMINAMDTEQTWHYVEAIHDDYVVYRKRERDSGDTMYYRQSYLMNEDGTVALTGDPIKVKRNVEYVQVNSNINSKEENVKMKKAKECCPEKVSALIANERSRFEEVDRDWLNELSPERLAQLEPKIQANRTPELTDEMVQAYLGSKSCDEVKSLLPENIQANIEAGEKAVKEHKDSVIDKIMNHAAKDAYKKEDLEGMQIGMLEMIAKAFPDAAPENGNYAGQANAQERPASGHGADVEPMGVWEESK